MPFASPFDLRAADLDRLNTLTKYPSIPTYHALDPAGGRLTAGAAAFGGPALLTEKVDGTNARVVLLPGGDYLIGSRAEFLLARGDLIGNPALGIVDALRDAADRLCDGYADEAVTVYFGEVYGGKVTGASRQYTGKRTVGFRLFDVARLADYGKLLGRPAAALSAWREGGGQTFLPEPDLAAAADRAGLDLTPRLATVPALPTGLEETAAFLAATLPRTRCALDDAAGGRPEGLVARTADRSAIAKLRTEDYRRTLRKPQRRR